MSNHMRAKEGNRGKRLGVGEDRASIRLCLSGFLSPSPPSSFSPLVLKLSCVPSSSQASDKSGPRAGHLAKVAQDSGRERSPRLSANGSWNAATPHFAWRLVCEVKNMNEATKGSPERKRACLRPHSKARGRDIFDFLNPRLNRDLCKEIPSLPSQPPCQMLVLALC